MGAQNSFTNEPVSTAGAARGRGAAGTSSIAGAFAITATGAPGAERSYICIDLKSFYASVECADLGLDPFKTNLVVADTSRGLGTICLALSPAIKAAGVTGRPRLFQIPKNIPYRAVQPRMRRYMEVSAQIYSIYLRYIAKEDIHVYSIDECFIDVTPYLSLYHTNARGIAQMLMSAVFKETHICATAGIGPNLFLCKVALDVLAKHEPSHMGELSVESFKERMWHHRPITDIWQIGPGIAARLARLGAYDLAGVAALDSATLFRTFGVNAQHLIDHAWGQEPCTIQEIQNYQPAQHSISVGQVLIRPYTSEEAHTVMLEMVDELVLSLVEKRLATGSLALWIGFEATDVDWELAARHRWPHGSISRKLTRHTYSREELMGEVEQLYQEAINPGFKIKRLGLCAGALVSADKSELTLFTNVEAEAQELHLVEATLAVRERFGKNALVRGRSFREEATGRSRNAQVGGHHE